MKILRNLLMAAVLLVVFTTNVSAITELPVYEICDFRYPESAIFVGRDEGVTVLDSGEVWSLSGLIRPNIKGDLWGVMVLVSVDSTVRVIDIYHFGGVYRNWTLACQNGANLRLHSDYLDCRFSGVC